ncbi:hypothetical protein K438DRAFT_1992888 [Mycena galopus ATCC 62051]|nr:hypothetical protein K438DRAFT_1992888 [Mycena galopus ATCC 62051]
MSDEPSKTKGKGGTKKSKKDTEDLQEVTHPALKEYKLFKKIEKDHYCQACKTACSEHYILIHTELATWAMLASHHQAILDGVPSQLGLDINHTWQQRAQNHRNKPTASSDSPMEWIRALTPIGNNLSKTSGEDAPAQISPGIMTCLPELDSDPIRDNGFFELSDLANILAE